MAMVRFVVEDYDKTSKNDFVGQYTLPLNCMQQGKAQKTVCHIMSQEQCFCLHAPLSDFYEHSPAELHLDFFL